jgi:hypothetical protein
VQLDIVVFNILWNTYNSSIWHPVYNSDKKHKTWGMLVFYISNTLYLKRYDVHSSYLTSFRLLFFKWILIRVSEWDGETMWPGNVKVGYSLLSCVVMQHLGSWWSTLKWNTVTGVSKLFTMSWPHVCWRIHAI